MIGHHYTVEIRHLFLSEKRSAQGIQDRPESCSDSSSSPVWCSKKCDGCIARRPSSNADSAVDQGRPTGCKWLAQKGNGLVKLGGKPAAGSGQVTG
jgi:hypothetical protein